MKTHVRNWLWVTLAGFFLATAWGCGSGGGGSSGSPGATATIDLDASRTEMPADGFSSCAITATVTDSTGAPATQGTEVTFTTTLGRFFDGSTTYVVKTPDATGKVIVSLMSGTDPGTAKVTVSSKGVTQRIEIEFTGPAAPGVPVAEAFGLSAEFLNISGLWRMGLADVITAYLADALGQAVGGVEVDFRTYNTGGSLSPAKDVAENGFAQSTLTSTPSPTPLEGFVSVTAQTQGGPTTRVSAIGVTPFPDNHILYAGTAGGGVYKSTDSGVTWRNVSRSSANPEQGQNWIDPYVKGNSAVCVDPDNPNTVYVGTGYLGRGGVYRSLDGGLNWNSNSSEEVFGLYSTTAAVLTVLCDDGGSDWVWIGTEGKGPLFATDGENFQPSTGTVSTPDPGPGNTGNGTMTQPLLSYSSQSETWTATCYVPQNASATIDTNTQPYIPFVQTSASTKTETWTLTCVQPSVPAQDGFCQDGTGDTEAACIADGGTWVPATPAVPAEFLVVGSISGLQSGQARVGVPFTSDGNEVSFTVYGDEFKQGQQLTFTTHISPPFWLVQGSASGVQGNIALNDTYYTSDNFEVGFIITEGTVPFATGDTFEFTVSASPLGHGWNVWDIVKVNGSHGASAVLYAGTHVGVYRSANGGRNWTAATDFAGDNITCLALHPSSTGGAADRIYAGTRDGGVWMSLNSGATWTRYASGMANGQSAHIKDLLVDPWSNYLYALTYTGSFGQAGGEVYAHPLNPDGSMGAGSWTAVNTGLGGAPLDALAADHPLFPTGLYAGGEGIALYRTAGGLPSGTPSWQSSTTGMDNTIMARMPVLFSGQVGMSVSYTQYESLTCFTVYVQDINGNPPITGSSFTAEYDGTTYYDIQYGDSYMHQGTFRDPSNPYTNWPYQFCVNVAPDTEATFGFTAACQDTAPGCSGLNQEVVIPF